MVTVTWTKTFLANHMEKVFVLVFFFLIKTIYIFFCNKMLYYTINPEIIYKSCISYLSFDGESSLWVSNSLFSSLFGFLGSFEFSQSSSDSSSFLSS